MLLLITPETRWRRAAACVIHDYGSREDLIDASSWWMTDDSAPSALLSFAILSASDASSLTTNELEAMIGSVFEEMGGWPTQADLVLAVVASVLDAPGADGKALATARRLRPLAWEHRRLLSGRLDEIDSDLDYIDDGVPCALETLGRDLVELRAELRLQHPEL